MSEGKRSVLSLNRFQRLSLWCRDCDSYWQLPNYMVVLHGSYDTELLKSVIKMNLYLQRIILGLPDSYFGEDFDFGNELVVILEMVRNTLKQKDTPIVIMDVDLIECIDQNIDHIANFITQMSISLEAMTRKIIDYSPKNFLAKLSIMRKNILKSLETNNFKCVLDNIMDLNIAGLDLLLQCIGVLFNFIYIALIDITAPETPIKGMIYCADPRVIIERLANVAAQNFFYRYKRRWLIFYREILLESSDLFLVDQKKYQSLLQCGNYETLESVLFNVYILRNPDLMKQLTILKHRERYPKNVGAIYDWWLGRPKEKLQEIYQLLDSTETIGKKSAMLPFILTSGMSVKDRIYHDLNYAMRMFNRSNPEVSTLFNAILKIYPHVFEQVYFPDREHYVTLNGGGDTSDMQQSSTKMPNVSDDKKTEAAAVIEAINLAANKFDNISDKNVLRKCENNKCQEQHGGKNVIWNLNTFEVGEYSMNHILYKVIENRRVVEDFLNEMKRNKSFKSAMENVLSKKIQKTIFR